MKKDERAILMAYRNQKAEQRELSRGKAILSALRPLSVPFQWLGTNIFNRNSTALALTAIADGFLMIGQVFHYVSVWMILPVVISVIAISVNPVLSDRKDTQNG